MYHQHWQLHSVPFRNHFDPRRVQASAGHEEALARLHFLADQRRRLGLLLGPAGCGKTLLLEAFAAELRRSGHDVALISLLGLDLHELLWRLNAAFHLNPGDGESVFQLWRRAVDHIAENRCQGLGTLLLFDDADEAAGDVLTHVLRLAHSDPTLDARLTIVLAADPTRLERLGTRLVDLAELRIDVGPWDLTDTIQYVASEIRRAGGESALFSDQALIRLHELAHGVPRRINQLADLALLAGAGQGLEQVDEQTLSLVHDELSIGAASLARV